MKILLISCSFFPDSIGGTETYVYNLAKELKVFGHDIMVNYVSNFSDKNAPLLKLRNYSFEDIPVFVIEKNVYGFKTRDIYFDSFELPSIYYIFKQYLEKTKPDIIHFHFISPHDSIAQMKAAKTLSIPIIFTFHTSGLICSRGDLLFYGKRECDGLLNEKICLLCMQKKFGIPHLLAWLWANLPKKLTDKLGSFIANLNATGRPATWLQLPWLVRKRIEKFKEELALIDHFIALSLWGEKLLIKNHIPKEKITLCRHGINLNINPAVKRHTDNVLHLGYLGRIYYYKGIDLLLNAFRLLPKSYKIELDIYGIANNKADEKYFHYLLRCSRKDSRIKWKGKVTEEEKFQILSQLDALVIPSRWLESGPLVLFESWAAGVPVIGANLGGISESIQNGNNGLLFKKNDFRDLARLIKQIYEQPDLLVKLKKQIPYVRTMKDVASEMEYLYQSFR